MHIVIDDVRPTVDCSCHAVKRTEGEVVNASAVVISHGHDTVRAELLYRRVDADHEANHEGKWSVAPMAQVEVDPDRFAGEFRVTECGRWEFTVRAWIDRIATWRDELRRKVEAGRADLTAELAEGAALLGVTALDAATALAPVEADPVRRDAETTSPTCQAVEVDPPVARFGAWYELFPRSFGGLRGVTTLVPRLAELGFDVLYLPPIHPIGTTNRKGRNNSAVAGAGDPGSPWAIGNADGGHCAVDPDLGTIDDFDELVRDAEAHGVTVALDLAYQCSPDHPWLAEHPEWFACGPTEPSSTPRTHPSATRTSSTSTSRPRTRPACGPPCAAWSRSGSATACGSSGSTTPTRSRSRSGSG